MHFQKVKLLDFPAIRPTEREVFNVSPGGLVAAAHFLSTSFFYC